MFTKDFYGVIDAELDLLIQKYQEDKIIKKHKSAINNQKSYVLLIWFLDFYGRISNYADFITDGDNDSSCDIVLDTINNDGNKVFYIVQSKWNNADNAEKETNKDEILKAINDFETILRDEKKIINSKLKEKLSELQLHLKANGEVKFIFLSLSQYKGNADENIESFRNQDIKTKFEVIDINRIRTDYIDRKYKKITPISPLKIHKNPEESPITLEIVQKSGCVKIEKPFEAYMFLLRPKTIWELFNTYSFSLFYKNVRNPLLQSQFNSDIENTAIDNPSYFWYYNNGITAITYELPEIGKRAEKINVIGLQIINGAQTVYAIYRAYEEANNTQRTTMNNQIFVTLRLLQSGGKDFDLNVTRYTNSQNPVQDRDFRANDDVQIALQNESYKTNIWYEKRRDEFREMPKGTKKVSNSLMANIYLAYHLQNPVDVLVNYHQQFNIQKDLNFISHKDNKNGLYEIIFNKNTSYEDMLAGFYVFDILSGENSYSYEDTFKTNIYHLLSLFKTIFTKYLKAKYDDKINVNKYIIKIYEKNEKQIILKTFDFLYQFIKNQIKNINIISQFSIENYQIIFDKIEKIKITIENIE